MPSSDRKVRVYEELADWEHRQGSPQARDRFLILAADAALTAGHNDEAERFRARLLELNPHHIVRPYASLADALKSSDVYSYIADLRNTYPVEEAEKLLAAFQGNKAPSEGHVPAGTPGAPQLPLPELPPPAAVFGSLPRNEEPAGAGTGSTVAEASELPPFRSLGESAEAAPSPGMSTQAAAPESTPEEEEGEGGPGGVGVFFSDALFVLLLVAGVVLAGYTLARPFLSLPDAPFK